MSDSRVEAKSLLAVDIGSVNTRALMFDAVEGRYRFLAEGYARTTVDFPIRDVSEGVWRALDQLQKRAGRPLIDDDQRLIVPSSQDGSGVDHFVVTYSAGPPLKVFGVGLLEDVSVASIRHLVSGTYAQVIGALSLNDQRKSEERIDLILRLRPDLVLIAGGTENGAKQSVLKLVESVGVACYLMADGPKPEILYAGNQALADEVKSMVGNLTTVHIAPNLRPGLHTEQLGPARGKFVEVFRAIRARQVQGIDELLAWSDQRVYPASTGFGRIIRFLSQVYDPSKGVLGVDVGGSSTTIAGAFAGDLKLSVFPDLGVGANLRNLLQHTEPQHIARWIPYEIHEDSVRDFLYNKSLYPDSLPVTADELLVEQAIAREMIRVSIQWARREFPTGASGPGRGLMPWFEPIVAAGGMLTKTPTHGQTLLILLDALQPTGVTTVVLDQNNLAAALGAAAAVNPALVVQVLESGTFLNLGTVISPVGSARPSTPILNCRLVYEDGSEIKVEVKQGTIEVLPLPVGQAARLHLQPLQRYDIAMGGPGRGGSLRVVGGELGIVIDARGRPLQLPVDASRRSEILKKWLWTLGG